MLIKDVEGNEYDAKPVGADSDTDICVLSVEALLGKATLFDSDDVEVGEDVIAIGNPLGILGGTVTKGIISASKRRVSVNGTEMDRERNGNASGMIVSPKLPKMIQKYIFRSTTAQNYQQLFT